MGTFSTPSAGTPVGIEHDGGGNLWLTAIGTTDEVHLMTTTGASIYSYTGNLGNPLGITSDGVNFYISDTTGDVVQVRDGAGTLYRDFPVASTFPEGITFNPQNGHLYVIDGTAGNQVIEYDTQGMQLAMYPLQGSSIDGIAYDPVFGGYWVTESGTDVVHHYDNSFVSVESFPSTLGAGEGLAVIANRLYIVDPTGRTVTEFDIGAASAVPILPTSAWVAEYGTGCGTTPMSLGSSATPVLGTNINLDIGSIPSGTVLGFQVLGLSGSLPGQDLTSLGFAGCRLFTANDASVTWMPPQMGNAQTVALTIPNDPAFRGFEVFTQSAALELPGGMLQLAMSNAVRLRLGQ